MKIDPTTQINKKLPIPVAHLNDFYFAEHFQNLAFSNFAEYGDSLATKNINRQRILDYLEDDLLPESDLYHDDHDSNTVDYIIYQSDTCKNLDPGRWWQDTAKNEKVLIDSDIDSIQMRVQAEEV